MPRQTTYAGIGVLEPELSEKREAKPANRRAASSLDEERLADYIGQMAAIRKSQAVIEFKLDGTIVDANDNFLNAVGYTLDEIKGRHHSMFVDETYRNSAERQRLPPANRRRRTPRKVGLPLCRRDILDHAPDRTTRVSKWPGSPKIFEPFLIAFARIEQETT